MLNSGKYFTLCATKKINILTLVLSEKKILNETKNHSPPPPFKLNGRSLTMSKSEISNSIGKIKNEISGLDRVSNKMIKHSQTILLPILHKNFNKYLTYGYYPTSWSSGYIIPIHVHKNSNVDNPNIYRGITVIQMLLENYSTKF